MKIVYVDDTFHPAFGYQSNPLAKFQQKQGHEVVIVTVSKDQIYASFRNFGATEDTVEKDDEYYTKISGVKVIRIPTKGYFMNRAVISPEMFKAVRDQNPDVVFVHCAETLTAMRFLMHRKEWPLMFDSHMLPMASKSKYAGLFEAGYRAVFRRIIENNHYYVIRTQDDDYVNSHLGIRSELTPYISFGTDTILFQPSSEAREKFRKENGISENDFVVIYTGKLTEAKGGKFLAETFKKKFDVPVTLVCVGTPPDSDYGREVQELLSESENRVIMFPTQRYMDLASYYQMADLSIFPKQCSMSFFDAQACGLPIVSEGNNINLERCSHGNGMNFEPENVEDFREKIKMFALMDKQTMAEYKNNSREYITSNFDYNAIAEEYTYYLEKSVDAYNSTDKGL